MRASGHKRRNGCSRPFIGARALIGIALLARPRVTLATIAGRSPGDRAELYARALGARHLAEAAILWRWTTPRVLRAGAAIDGIHAVSALPLVVTNHDRHLAALNVGSAMTFALLGVALARNMS